MADSRGQIFPPAFFKLCNMPDCFSSVRYLHFISGLFKEDVSPDKLPVPLDENNKKIITRKINHSGCKNIFNKYFPAGLRTSLSLIRFFRGPVGFFE